MTKSFVNETVPRAPVVLAAMDKFRGTASARQLSEVVARAALVQECNSDVQPMSDGGEGFRDAFEGDVLTVQVPGPLGEPVQSTITLCQAASGLAAVVEVAEVVGRHLLDSPTRSEALAASSAGVGHLILASAGYGARSVLIGCGGSATSDGGLGCYQVLKGAGGLPVPVTAATDVTAHFSGARRYALQKGIHPDDLESLENQLSDVRALYLANEGVDVELLARSGASGGIPGALAALGGVLTSGFDAVSRAVALQDRVSRSSLVVSGEGRFDEGSLEGKVAWGMAGLARDRVPLLLICGSVEPGAEEIFLRDFSDVKLVSLVERFGESEAFTNTVACVESVVAEEIRVGPGAKRPTA